MSDNKAQPFIELHNRAKEAPDKPGVYFWKDPDGVVIYVGKAKSLKNRLSSYFISKRNIKTKHLVEHAVTIEWIFTETEYDALLLENTMIKKYNPKYNIMLKDGKSYPAIRITNEEYPRIFRTRYIVNDGSKYFGPYPDATAMDTYLELTQRLFPLRRCKNFKKRDSPCMYFHINRCPGPCAKKITHEDYMKAVGHIVSLLSGNTKTLVKNLKKEMLEASEKLQFEKAAFLRDSIAAVENFQGNSGIENFTVGDRDYVSWLSDSSFIDFVVFQSRNGKLMGRDLFRERFYGTETEAVSQFLTSYYTKDRLPPPEVFVKDTENLELVHKYLKEYLKTDFLFEKPKEKRHVAAMAMTELNAKEDMVKRRKDTGDLEAMEALRKTLNLKKMPRLIEGYDIAQLAGKHTVASLISFKNGIPNRKGYRIYKIKSLDGGIDDFGAMREVTARHYSSVANGESEVPDLIMIDGGLGQVNAAWSIVNALGLDIPIVGLAKENEELWLHEAKSSIVLPHDNPGLRLLVAIRDETHRFATSMNQKLRGKDISFGILESINKIGSIKAKKIMKEFGSLQNIAEASPEYIAKIAGVNVDTANEIKKIAEEKKNAK